MTKTETLKLLNKLDKKLNSMSADEIVGMVISSNALGFFSDDIVPVLPYSSFSISGVNHNNKNVSWDNVTGIEDYNLSYNNCYFSNKDLMVA
ncbi:hypothetical protein [Treponema denticola]|uniref:Uncharacterized protein n=1 Tax=Treponema denticola SP33 TaxID=999437 RepID=M2BD35_TREDN|nr:hypothetical protein [Treponema denticola]EMB19543.1 hypothetical protein HMPREF9733_02643 [Treponema denticola SP33]EPF38094.1 hypothetical protein HMPREF9732_00059 [Treponema denticola SP32]